MKSHKKLQDRNIPHILTLFKKYPYGVSRDTFNFLKALYTL